MSNDVQAADVTGCFWAVWSLCVTTPMWYILIYFLLTAAGSNLPVAAWVLYWCYVPAGIVGTLLRGFADSLRST